MTARIRKCIFLFIAVVLVLCGLQVQPQGSSACRLADTTAAGTLTGERLNAVASHSTEQAAMKETAGNGLLSVLSVSVKMHTVSIRLLTAVFLLMAAAGLKTLSEFLRRKSICSGNTFSGRFIISFIHFHSGLLSA